ncbi:MAG: transglutaminase TgpA family protein [Nitriliruptorales bacterium]
MGRLLEAYRRVNLAKRPEPSVPLRIAVLVTVMIAVVAVAVNGAASAGAVVGAIALLPAGAWLSHRRRAADNTVVKLLLTVGAVLALSRFFGELRIAATIEDTRRPLADLFLAVQVLHGFDLPQRRDLGFTLASSVALVALAGTEARGSVFGIVLLAYLVAAAVASAWMQRSLAEEWADDLVGPDGVRFAGTALTSGEPASRTNLRFLRVTTAAVLVGTAVYLVLPRTDAARLGGLPFSGFPGVQVAGAGVVNPGLPYGGDPPAPGDSPPAFSPNAYFGLAEYVDLRTRGVPSERLVMRVRSNRPRFWRGMVFDHYEDSGWTRTAEAPEQRQGLPVSLTFPFAPDARNEPVIQTYELVMQTPNLVFAAANPIEVYLSAGSVGQWDDGTLTTSGEQEEGIVYSVVSLIDASPREALRAADGAIPAHISERYLQLPDDLPQRVRDLGVRLTADATTPYGKAEAVERWLGDNVSYSLDLTPQEPGADAVDWFLFEHQRGWCEPIASSMVVMLRAAGIPARYVTGFQPGTRNPFSGWYEVRVADAHAWVEVWVPGHGWTAFDPTGAVPQAVDSTARLPRLAAIDLARWIADFVPDGTGRVLLGLLSRAGAPASVLLLGAAAVLVVRRRRTADQSAPPTPFARLEALLADHGVGRDTWQTPREFVARIRLRRPELPEGPLIDLLQAEEEDRYGRGSSHDEDDLEQALAQVVDRLRVEC